MKLVAAEDLECGDTVLVLRKPPGVWYARKADSSERPNAVAKTFIGQDDVCHWDQSNGTLIKGDEHD